MNVLYINHTILKSGAAISLSTLVRHFPTQVRACFMIRKKCEIADMLGATPDRTFRERFMVEFMTTLYVSPYPLWLFFWHVLKIPMAFLRMRQLKRKWNLDLIHANESTLLAYVFAARLAGLPVVLHARTALAKRPFELFLLRRIARLRGTRIIAIDGEVKASLPEPAQKITRVIYNPIELGPPPSLREIVDLRRSWGVAPDEIVIGQVASLHSQKGIWLILDLAETLCPEFPALRFVLVGDNSAAAGEGPQLEEAILQRGLTARVILPGYNSNLAAVYASLDIALCLFGGGLGGVGRSAYEAALAGKPLVATLPDPNASNTLINGVSARLFRPADRAGLLQALRHLIADREAREKLGASAKAALGERHSPERIAQMMFELYRELTISAKPT